MGIDRQRLIRKALAMKKIISAVITMILFPSVAFSQQPLPQAVCSKVNSAVVVPLNLRVVKKQHLAKELKKELSESPQVVVCAEEVTKSAGHGLLGFAKWDKRRVAQVKLLKIDQNKYAVTDIVKFTELKAPFGKWRIKEVVPKSLNTKTSLFSAKQLPDIPKKLLSLNYDEVTFSVGALNPKK